MAVTPAKKRINLQQLIREGKPVWVLNQSGKYIKSLGKKGRAGVVVFQIGTGDTVDKVVIPPGPDPVCISDQIDAKSLETCRDLMKLTSQGVLEVLDPAKAEEYYARNEERRELAEAKIQKQRDNAQDAAPKSAVAAPGEPNQMVDPLVRNLLLKRSGDKISVADAIETLNENSDGLTGSDTEYILSVSTDKDIRDWAAKRASK